MSTSSVQNAATSSGSETMSKKQQRKQRRKNLRRQGNLENISPKQYPPQTGATSRARPGVDSNLSRDKFVSALTKQDVAILEYLETLTNPWIETPAPVPLVVGEFALETEPFQMVYEGEAMAGTNGVAYVCVEPSAWVPALGSSVLPAAQFESYSGGTQGNMIFSSLALPAAANAGATGFPAQGTAPTANVHLGTPSRLVEPAWNINSRVRVVSVGLEVFSDSSVNNATGKIMVCSTVLPVDGPGLGGLDGATFGNIVTTPRKLIERTEMPLSGWVNGNVLRTYAVPAQQCCFELNTMPGAGLLNVNCPIIGAIAQGMQSNQTFAWRVVINYEAIADVSNKTSATSRNVIHAGGERVSNALPHIRPFMTAGGDAGAISGAPIAVHALTQEMGIHRPMHAASVIQMAKRPALLDDIRKFDMSTLKPVATAALAKVANSGWLKNIPVFGNLIDTGAKFLSGLFK